MDHTFSEPCFLQGCEGLGRGPRAKTLGRSHLWGLSTPAGVKGPMRAGAREDQRGRATVCALVGSPHWRRFAAPWWFHGILILPRTEGSDSTTHTHPPCDPQVHPDPPGGPTSSPKVSPTPTQRRPRSKKYKVILEITGSGPDWDAFQLRDLGWVRSPSRASVSPPPCGTGIVMMALFHSAAMSVRADGEQGVLRRAPGASAAPGEVGMLSSPARAWEETEQPLPFLSPW